LKQCGEAVADGVLTETSKEADRSSQSRQTTSHIGGCSTKAILHWSVVRRITARRAKSIDQRLPEAENG
jgi:hypothetical protein